MKKILSIVIAVLLAAVMATSAFAFYFPNGNQWPEGFGQSGVQNELWKSFDYTTYVQYDAISISAYENPTWDQVNEDYYRITDSWIPGSEGTPITIPERADCPEDMPNGVKCVIFKGWLIGEAEIECFEWTMNNGTTREWSPKVSVEDQADPTNQTICGWRDAFGDTLDAAYSNGQYWRNGANMDACKYYIIVPVEYETQTVQCYVKYANGTSELFWNCTINLPDGKPVGGGDTPTLKAGDVNGDGDVNNKDVALLFRYLGDENSVPASFRLDLADVNSDGDVNNKDVATLFRQVSAG